MPGRCANPQAFGDLQTITRKMRRAVCTRSGAVKRHSVSRNGITWRIRPGVLRVSAAQLLANLRIRALPEAREVVRHLNRPVARREYVQHDGEPARCDSGGGGET